VKEKYLERMRGKFEGWINSDLCFLCNL
jgi:hypothetical protein